jgi:hypothetical protein
MSDRQIIEAIQKIAGTQLADEVYMIPCTVESVDLDALTCDCIAVGGTAVTDIPGVQLMAEVDDGMYLVPSIGSIVLVIYSKRQPPFIALFSQLDDVVFNIGNSALEISTTAVKINDGSFGGLVKVTEIVTRLNNIENGFNLLNTKVNALAPTPVIPPLVTTVRAMIENPIITHGE